MAGPINPTLLTWTAPQTNANGTNLNDLKEYRVIVGPSATGPWTQVAVVLAPTPDPAPGATASSPTSTWGALTPGQYYASVRAADIAGNVSGEAVSVPFELTDVLAPSPVTALLFS